MALVGREAEESFLLFSRYVKLLLINLSFHICAEMQILFLTITFYSFCSSTEINSICNKNVLFELMVFFSSVLPHSRCENASSYCRSNNASSVVKRLADYAHKPNQRIFFFSFQDAPGRCNFW